MASASAQAQDTLYVCRAGVVSKHAINNIDSLLFSKPRITIYQYIKGLGADYSIIRDSVLKYSVKQFDKTNSTPIGVDNTGNTVYDSVFTVYNPIFDKVPFNSTSNQSTVLLPSNDVINSCYANLATLYKQMGKVLTAADSTVAWTWIKQAIFFNGTLTTLSPVDLTSAYGKIWRTTVQQLDSNNPIKMCNGILYKIKWMKIPNNVIISRIKSLTEYWQYQDETSKYPNAGDLYTFKGITANSVKATVADATPNPTVLPNYVILDVTGDVSSTDEFSVEFPPLERYVGTDGKYHARVMEVPTGEYYLYMGFMSGKHPWVTFYFNGVQVGNSCQVSLSIPWNYDRITETTDGIIKWNGLGGQVGTVNVTKSDGTNGLASFKIKIQFDKVAYGGEKQFRIYHWALKPTANNY